MLDPTLAAATHGHVHQVEIVADLFRAQFDPVTTVGESFADVVLGLGVAEACDGEIVGFDGQVWRIPADGVPVIAPPELGLPFAVVAEGGTPVEVPIPPGSTFSDIAATVTAALPEDPHAVAAVRLDGIFTDVVLRSEHRQEPPYEPLPAVLENEVRFPFDTWEGTLVGFRFPTVDDGLIIPGLHLHGVAADHQSGGHVHEATVDVAVLRMWIDDSDITVPHDGLARALVRDEVQPD